MKEQIEEYVIGIVLPALVTEETVSLKQLTGFKNDDVFNTFGHCLLEGCSELDLDKVCTR